MKIVHQVRTNKITDAFVQELDMTTNAVIYGAIRQVIKANNTDESLRSLEFLLQTILKGQGQTEYLYDQNNY